jgi:hypothetical protein
MNIPFIHEIHVVTAILDPAQRNLHFINENFNDNNTTAGDLFSNFIDRYVGSTTNDVPESTL